MGKEQGEPAKASWRLSAHRINGDATPLAALLNGRSAFLRFIGAEVRGKGERREGEVTKCFVSEC